LSPLGSEFLSVVYGLASAASWGAADFSGGVATKRTPVYGVVIVSQLVGGILLLPVALIYAEATPSPGSLLLGGIAGVSGALGLIALYTGLAGGRMGVVAPVTGMVTAVLPVVVGILDEGLPSIYHLLGFGVAFLAVWFLSRGSNEATIGVPELGLSIAAGAGFGLFFVLIDLVSSDAILWPLVSARVASTSLLSLFSALRRQRVGPVRHQLLIIALAGILDTGGNAFFALATRAGRLDISSVLASLYPAGTVLLAQLFLKERLDQHQWIGVIAAVVALALIAT